MSKNTSQVINNLKTLSVTHFPKGDLILQGEFNSNIAIYDANNYEQIDTINGTLSASLIMVNFNGERIAT